jgi:hypothetical protein
MIRLVKTKRDGWMDGWIFPGAGRENFGGADRRRKMASG